MKAWFRRRPTDPPPHPAGRNAERVRGPGPSGSGAIGTGGRGAGAVWGGESSGEKSANEELVAPGGRRWAKWKSKDKIEGL